MNPHPLQSPLTPRVAYLLSWAIIITALYFAQDILIPCAIAILVSFLLAPVVTRLEKWKLKRAPSVVIVLLAALTLVGALGYLVVNQFVDVATELPRYQETILQKAQNLKPDPGSTFGRIGSDFERMGREVSRRLKPQRQRADQLGQVRDDTPGAGSTAENLVMAASAFTTMSATADSPTGDAKEDSAVPVRVIEGPPTPMQTAADMLSPAFSFLGRVGLVVVLVLFFLLQREDLRDRALRLAGQGRIRLTTSALDEAGDRVSRYLLMQFIVNVTYGIPVGVGLWLIGLPNALLWGVLCAVLRFIPYLGPWIGASIPILLSIAIFDGWGPTFATIGLFIVIELISNNAIEPYLYGHNTGLSPVAIILAAIFWTWLWGMAGLLLSTPLTVCLLVLGRHVPQLAFLDVLLGDEPALPPEVRIYNRLLAGNTEEAIDVAEETAKGKELVEIADTVLLPTLALIEQDKSSGALNPERTKALLNEFEDIYAELAKASQQQQNKERDADHAANGPPQEMQTALPPRRVLCIAAHDVADEHAANILANFLQTDRYIVKVLTSGTLAGEALEEIRSFQPDVLVISALPPMAAVHARYLCKRIHNQDLGIKTILALWTDTSKPPSGSRRPKETESYQTMYSLREVLLHI
jgi:predicted PurR-regulated permease PerM